MGHPTRLAFCIGCLCALLAGGMSCDKKAPAPPKTSGKQKPPGPVVRAPLNSAQLDSVFALLPRQTAFLVSLRSLNRIGKLVGLKKLATVLPIQFAKLGGDALKTLGFNALTPAGWKSIGVALDRPLALAMLQLRPGTVLGIALGIRDRKIFEAFLGRVPTAKFTRRVHGDALLFSAPEIGHFILRRNSALYVFGEHKNDRKFADLLVRRLVVQKRDDSLSRDKHFLSSGMDLKADLVAYLNFPGMLPLVDGEIKSFKRNLVTLPLTPAAKRRLKGTIAVFAFARTILAGMHGLSISCRARGGELSVFWRLGLSGNSPLRRLFAPGNRLVGAGFVKTEPLMTAALRLDLNGVWALAKKAAAVIEPGALLVLNSVVKKSFEKEVLPLLGGNIEVYFDLPSPRLGATDPATTFHAFMPVPDGAKLELLFKGLVASKLKSSTIENKRVYLLPGPLGKLRLAFVDKLVVLSTNDKLVARVIKNSPAGSFVDRVKEPVARQIYRGKSGIFWYVHSKMIGRMLRGQLNTLRNSTTFDSRLLLFTSKLHAKDPNSEKLKRLNGLSKRQQQLRSAKLVGGMELSIKLWNSFGTWGGTLQVDRSGFYGSGWWKVQSRTFSELFISYARDVMRLESKMKANRVEARKIQLQINALIGTPGKTKK